VWSSKTSTPNRRRTARSGCTRSKRGALVTSKGKADPRQVEILTGQTVFFAVVEAPGITITDQRLSPG
jgi:hypothetical protein